MSGGTSYEARRDAHNRRVLDGMSRVYAGGVEIVGPTVGAPQPPERTAQAQRERLIAAGYVPDERVPEPTVAYISPAPALPERRWCGYCGFEFAIGHEAGCAAPRDEVLYCPRDGVWLGTHRKCKICGRLGSVPGYPRHAPCGHES